jgi:hypothetical protein
MYLSAKGFTYSSPTLKVKMSQDKVVEVPATQQNLPSNEAPKQIEAAPVVKPAPKKSITCVKGKTVKKVTGTIPKCPKGWKKK